MRSPKHVLLAVVALTSATLSVACSAPAGSDAAVSEGALTGTARKGDEFVRCWSTADGAAGDFFTRYAVTCHVSSKGLPGLAGSPVYVDARGADGATVSGSPGDKPDQDVVIGSVSSSSFPLSLTVYGLWTTAPTTVLSGFHLKVAAPIAATATAPVIVKLPFDIWPVTILNRLSLSVLSSRPYDVSVAPFTTDQNGNGTKTAFTTTFDSDVMRGPRFDFNLFAPPSGGIPVQVSGVAGSSSATISAPGVYVIDDSGLRLATADEEAAAGPAPSPAGGADAGPSADAAPAPPPPDAAPTTTCGGPGQQHCTTNGSWSCIDGTRADTDTGICLACGDDGEPHCVTDPRNVQGNWRCNAGTRADTDSGNCVACGSVGKVYCFDDPNNVRGNAVCDAGLHYDSNGICVN